MNCPNCGSGETDRENVLERWCAECGTLFYDDGSEIVVPTRSRPAEVLELPDAEGCWWTVERKMYIEVFLDGGKRPYSFSRQGVRCYCPTGRYVRCVPPIIAPAKPEPDPDAEKLRRFAKYLDGCGSEDFPARLYGVNAEDANRIADDLERLKREAKERA